MGRRLGDQGFVLLETLVAISLTSVVMAGFTTFFVNSVAYTTLQRATQTAVEIANSEVDAIRALPASDRVNGHDDSSVAVQFSPLTVPPRVLPYLSAMVPALANTLPLPAPGSGTTAALPTVPIPQQVNNVDYSVNVYLGSCWILAPLSVGATCALQTTADGICTGAAAVCWLPYLRAVVAVTWSGSRCPPTLCTYVTSTLLSTKDDPLFAPNQTPPPLPILVSPGDQISAVGDTVDLALGISAAPPYTVVVTTGIWPPGLNLDAATFHIVGSPLAVQASTPLTLTLTDAYGRITTATFNWTVLAALVGVAPTAQAGIIGVAITTLIVSATGGQRPYIWSDPGATLPPGLTLSTLSNNMASITGPPTTVKQYDPVTLTVTDSKNRTSTISFTWTIDYPPFVAANPGLQTSTLNTADTVTLSVTGGSGTFEWTGGATLPAGLTLTTAGVISGSPTATGTKSVTLQVTDSKALVQKPVTVKFDWTVFAKPTVTSPGDQAWTVGMTFGTPFKLQLATTCPNTPCAYLLNNGPGTLAISPTGLLSGTVTGSAQLFNSVTVSVTDSSKATVPSASFTVTVNAAPGVRSPGDQTSAFSTSNVSLSVAALVSGGTAPFSYSATNLPSWLTLDSSTGLITNFSPSTAGTTGIVLTVRDAVGVSASSAPSFNWVVGGPPSAPQNVTVDNRDRTASVAWTAPAINGAAVSYTVTVSPAATCTFPTATTCSLSGLTNGRVYSVRVTATNSFDTGPASTVNVNPYPAGVMSGSGMTLWLDGADPTALLSTCGGAMTTTAIGCWRDKGGQGNNFVQAPGTSQPGVSTWNGLSAANFADTGDVLNSVNGSAQYQTVFVAAKVTGAGAFSDLFGQSTQDYNVRIGSGTWRSGSNSSFNSHDWSTNTGNPPLNWTNGAQAVNVTTPLPVITFDQAQSVNTFAASVSNSFMGRGVVGQVGEVITFNRVLSVLERRAVEEYLSNKWGVTITPEAPTSVTGVGGNKTHAVVSWAAPSLNGGATVSGYTITSSGGQTCTTTGGLSCDVLGLNNNAYYTFTVTATNSVGDGPASNPSGRVRP